MKIVIIGQSGHANYVLQENQKNFTIEGIAPGCEGESVSELRKKLPSDQKIIVDEDWRVLLDRVKPDIAVINTWFGYAPPVIIGALERGCHVFAEKPLAGTLDDLDKVEGAWKKTGRHLAAMFGIKYEAPFLKAHELIEAGKIGQVRLLTGQKSYKLGSRADFYKHRETYTGTIPWVACHAVEWIYWLSGRKRVTDFMAYHSRIGNNNHGDLEMTALCTMKMEDEVLANVYIDYLRPQAAETHGDDRIRVAGTRGILEVRGGELFLIDDKGETTVTCGPEGSIFADFLNRVKTGKSGHITAEDSLYVTRLCLEMRDSADRKM
jgi:predicted dehydrogenase